MVVVRSLAMRQLTTGLFLSDSGGPSLPLTSLTGSSSVGAFLFLYSAAVGPSGRPARRGGGRAAYPFFERLDDVEGCFVVGEGRCLHFFDAGGFLRSETRKRTYRPCDRIVEMHLSVSRMFLFHEQLGSHGQVI